ncbi:MAG TPA: O-methyltransferase [Thermoanaerobaculia bacterium]|nr:O-methyltransferase [Thermoanaerobaculia bacterium]
MKHRVGAILRPEQERYLERLQPPRDPLLAEMEAYAAEHDVPISDPEVGRLLELLAAAAARSGLPRPGEPPPRILEVGTAIGYGALLLARAAPEARIVTIDRDPEMLERARGYLERAGVAERVELVEGEALEALERVEGPFVLAYVDAEKVHYRRYLDRIVPKLAVGGMAAFDNLLWKGRVAEPSEDEEDEAAEALRAFNAYLMIHPQLRAQILAIGDGFGIATKLRPTVLEMGGPF